jgi:uncharacterized protein YcbK (DUF882 family)
MNHAEFWNAVTVLCLTYDSWTTSGPRSPAHNIQVGGVPDSYHVLGLAADVVLAQQSKFEQFARHAIRLNLWIYDERTTKNHIHLQPR